MLKNDYIMRMVMDLVTVVAKVWALPEPKRKDYLDEIEESIGKAVNIDPHLFFSLEPESAASLMEIGDETDKTLASFVVNSIFFEVKLLEAEDKMGLAKLRREQAIAIAQRFDVEVPGEQLSAEGIVELLSEAHEELKNSESSSKDELESKTDLNEEKSKLEKQYADSGFSLDAFKFDDDF